MSDRPLFPAQPERGWGQVLSLYFKDEGRWDTVMNELRPGDCVIIQFGHNDQKSHDPNRFTEPFGTYKANLERYVRETRALGSCAGIGPVVAVVANDAGFRTVPFNLNKATTGCGYGWMVIISLS